MKKQMKSIPAVLAAVMVLALFVGCGKGNAEEASAVDDPNIGVWQAMLVEMFDTEFPAADVFADGFELELMAGGKCELRSEGEADKYDWTIEDDTLAVKVKGDTIIEADVDGDEMVIGDFMQTGMKIILAREGTFVAADPSGDSEADATEAPGDETVDTDESDKENDDSAINIPMLPGSEETDDAGYYAIDSMTVDGEVYDADDLEDLSIYYYIRLQENNTAIISTDRLIVGIWGDNAIRYLLDGEEFVNPYTLDGDALTIDIVDEDSSATLSFLRYEESGTEAEELWNRAWYGYLWITEEYPDSVEEDILMDVYLALDIDWDGSGYFELILGDDVENLAFAYVQADENHFEVTEGYFMDMELDPELWWLAPSPVDEGTLLVIGDAYFVPESDGMEGFEYMICLRPFGDLWEQEESEDSYLPPGYEAYLEMLALAERLGSGAGSTEGGLTEADPETDDEDNRETTDSAGPDAGSLSELSFTRAELETIYEALNAAYNGNSLRDLLYEEVALTYFDGGAGTLDMDGSTLTIYKWYASDDPAAYVQVSFQDYSGDGARTAGGIGSYFP